MSTVQLEVRRKEAPEEEIEEIERIRKKYKERQKLKNHPESIDSEKQALIKQAQQQEQQQKEKLIQKYKQRQQQGQLKNTNQTLNQEKQALIKQAQQQEQQEKEKLIQKYKQRLQRKQENPTPITTPENEDSLEKSIDHKSTDKKSFGELFEKYNIYQEIESDIQLENDYLNKDVDLDPLTLENRDLEEFGDSVKEMKTDDETVILENNHFNTTLDEHNTIMGKFDIETLQETTEIIKNSEPHTPTGKNLIKSKIEENNIQSGDVENLGVENEEIETVDRTALMAKYNLLDVKEDDVDRILQDFDRTILDEDVEEIEEQLVERIKNSSLSHEKIEWVNVLVFFDEEKLEGSIKIFANYINGGLLTRLRSEDIERLELELMQLALYEVWDVFTTLGVNIDDLESKLDIEIALDRA